MTMPRFTAERSLYQTDEHYKLAAGWVDATSGQAVILQQFTWCSPCLRCEIAGWSLKVCCSSQWGWPPINCTFQGC